MFGMFLGGPFFSVTEEREDTAMLKTWGGGGGGRDENRESNDQVCSRELCGDGHEIRENCVNGDMLMVSELMSRFEMC